MVLRHITLTFAAGAAFAFLIVAAPAIGVTTAQAQVSAEFQAALQPYGSWRRHARWGMVWVPAKRPNGWRPYTHGHWVYTQDWGWYWISDRDEEDWGWVTFHYGRWIFDRDMGGWAWRSDDEWAPAWVAWRRGDDTVGWMAMPPDELMDDYDEAPDFWVFVAPRYLTDERVRAHTVPRAGMLSALRTTVVVNRTRTQGRIAHNPGISAAIIAAAARTPIPAYRVVPRVLAGTKGVTHAVTVPPRDLARSGGNRFGVSVLKTATAIKPAASVPKPEPLASKSSAQPDANPTPGRVHGVVAPANPPPQLPPTSHKGEPAPQAKPIRPIAPQTPPPTMPRAGARKQPAATSISPPPRPVATPVASPVAKPVVKPVPPPRKPEAKKQTMAKKPPPPTKRRPGQKPDDKK
jgi:hypothetical protein